MPQSREDLTLLNQVEALEQALKPFAEFWLGRAPFSSEPSDEQVYMNAPSRSVNGSSMITCGDFRRALRVFQEMAHD